MTDRHDGHRGAAESGIIARPEVESRWAALGDRPAPPAPKGAAGALADRIFVYVKPGKVQTVLPYLNNSCSGLIISGDKPGKGLQLQMESDFDGPVAIDPACYETYTATCEAPFRLPENRLRVASLEDVLDEQLQAGVAVAFTSTGYIPPDGTDELKVAVAEFKNTDRNDAIFVAPLDISLLGRSYIRQTTAILADLDGPVAVILGRQFDPLEQAKQLIPALRELAVTVPLIPMRTDFNAFDLVAHGAFAGAIGTGGKLRHTVDPTEKPRSYNSRDQSPSVLVPELLSWLRGSKIAELFGSRPSIVPRCDCPVCDGQRLSRFLRREHQNEAIAHAVAVWSRRAADLLDAPTVRKRAEYWRNLCSGAVQAHTMFREQMRMLDGLQPQLPLQTWATLPAWPTEVTTVTV